MPPADPDPETPPSPAVVSLPAMEAEDLDLLFFFPEEREPFGGGDLPAFCSVSILEVGEDRRGRQYNFFYFRDLRVECVGREGD